MIKVLKMVSGEELLAEVLQELPTSIRVKNPIVIMMQRTPNNEVGMGFLPYLPYCESREFEFKTEHVIVAKEVDNELKNQYNKIFGGIITPSKKLLIT
jgi:hypothetical protein